jgi:hypothetical protein
MPWGARGCEASGVTAFVPPAGLWAASASAAQNEISGAADGDREPSGQEAKDLEFLRPILLSPNGDQPTRIGAVERLLAMDHPQATAALDEALRSGREPVVLAVLTVLHQAPAPVEALRPACIAALRNVPPAARGALGCALSRFGRDALPDVAEIAQLDSSSADQRLGAIYVLGEFRSPRSAEVLIALLAEDRTEPAEIVAMACESLERLTGLDYGGDVERWRAWWRETKDLPDDEWYEAIAHRLGERLSDLNDAIANERAARQQVLHRLSSVYGDLFPALSIDEQLSRLPGMLEDDLVAVREFAIRRIERLTRDSVRLTPELQAKLPRCLDDEESPSVRIEAARLLDQLNVETTAELLAERLRTEQDPSVIEAHLEILARRPTPMAANHAHRWIRDERLGVPAVKMIWSVPNLRELPEQTRTAIRDGLESDEGAPRSPYHERLLACLRDESRRELSESLLESDDPAMRSAVAEGFARRGARQPLLDRADDPAIYPHAVRVVAQGDAALSNFRQLAALRPPDGLHDVWAEAVRKLAARLPIGDLLDADLALSETGYAPPELRVEVLSRAMTNNTDDAYPAEMQAALLVRLAPLLMQTSRAAEADELLSQLNGAATSPALLKVQFRAAALAGRSEAAAEYSRDPMAWIQLLSWIAPFDSQAAHALREEIERRFTGQLVGDVREAFERAVAELAASEAEATVEGDGRAPPAQPGALSEAEEGL